jgi:hypothetical protein
VDLTNQTNASLIFSNAAANTVGYYSCDVTDQTGSTVTSSNAALNITGVDFNLWQGLQLYYQFHGNYNDSSINANNGSNSGTFFGVDRYGKNSNSLVVTSNSFVTSLNNIPIFGNSDRTVTLWFKPSSNPIGWNGFLVAWGVPNNQHGHNGIFYSTGNYGIAEIDADYSDELINCNPNNLINRWHHLVVTYSQNVNNTIFYVDGGRVYNNPAYDGEYDIDTIVSQVVINGEIVGFGHFGINGNISDVRIYNRTLSSNEVSALFQAEAPVPTNNQTITFLTIPGKAFGTAPFSLTATTSAGTNYPITYSSSDPTVATVSSNKVTITGVGSCLITASQAGDFTYKATNMSRTLTVTQGNQSIAFSAPASRSYSTNTFTLPLNSSAGLPIIYDSSSAAVATISGNVVTLNGPGSTVITATQDGNANYKAAPAVTRTLVVSQAAQTISFADLPARTYGAASFNLTATATSGLPITYTSSNTNVATVSGNTVTIKGVGSTTITASQAGNANYVAAPSVGQVLTVTKAAQTISFAALPSKTYGDGTFSLSATASSGLPVTYASANTNVATISGSTVTIRGAGTASITASQPGNNNYNAATAVAKTLTVAKAAQSVSFSPTTPVTYVKSGTFALSPTSSASVTGTNVTFVSGNTAILTISGRTATMKAKGTVNVTTTAAATANYNATSTTNSITLQ